MYSNTYWDFCLLNQYVLTLSHFEAKARTNRAKRQPASLNTHRQRGSPSSAPLAISLHKPATLDFSKLLYKYGRISNLKEIKTGD